VTGVGSMAAQGPINWTLEQVAQACGGAIAVPCDARITGVSTDSRRIKPGDLFVALQGRQFDGHDFVSAAVDAGAAAVAVSREPTGLPPGAGVVLVEDTLLALGALGRRHREQFDVAVVAITGSTGKTTTKEMTAAILRELGETLSSPGTENNEVGVPRSLLRLTAGHRYAVLEFAMRGPGQIKYLAEMAEPRVGVVTNVGVSHLGLLGSREKVAAAKGELLAALSAEGLAVINRDDRFWGLLEQLAPCPVLSFGLGSEAAVRAEDLRPQDQGGTTFRLCLPAGTASVELQVPGEHNVMNALAAAAAAHGLGATAEQVAAGLGGYRGAEHRLQVRTAPGGWTILDDCYNASPDSLAAALDVLRRLPCAGRRVLVFADMLELGEVSREEHILAGESAIEAGVQVWLSYGEQAVVAARAAEQRGGGAVQVEHFPTLERLCAAAAETIQPGDLVLVKGSNGMNLIEVVRRLQDAC